MFNAVQYTQTTMKAMCNPPELNIVGATTISMSIDGGISYKYHSQIIISESTTSS